MAKIEVLPEIKDMCTLKDINAKLKSHCDLYRITRISSLGKSFVYMVVEEDVKADHIAVLDDDTVLSTLDGRLINAARVSSFGKYIKKTKLRFAERVDQITYYTDESREEGHDHDLILHSVEEEQLTSCYNLLFKDEAFTEKIVNIISGITTDVMWETFTDEELNCLLNHDCVTHVIEDDKIIYFNNQVFGNSKTYTDIGYGVVGKDEGSFIVLFRQKEKNLTIYHIYRFLKIYHQE